MNRTYLENKIADCEKSIEAIKPMAELKLKEYEKVSCDLAYMAFTCSNLKKLLAGLLQAEHEEKERDRIQKEKELANQPNNNNQLPEPETEAKGENF